MTVRTPMPLGDGERTPTAPVKRPSLQWYPSDWRNDLPLRACSIGARGLWQEMLVTMHFGTPYGHLSLDGVPLTDDEVAALCGVSLKDYRTLRAELERRKVFSRTPDGIIYSRRMVRDEAVRNKRAKGGNDGAIFGTLGAEHGVRGGRPSKSKGGLKTPLPSRTPRDAEPPLYPPPSSSSSSSTAVPPSAADAAASPPHGAAAAAAAASDVPDPEAYGAKRAAIRARFSDERHQLAFDRQCRAHRHPDVLLLDLEAAASPRPSDGAPGLPWDVIGTVLHELSVKGKLATEHLLRVFGAPILQPATRALSGPITTAPSEAEIEAEMRRRIDAGEFLPPAYQEATHG